MNTKLASVLGAIAALAVLLLFTLTPAGSWLSSRSDSLWWMLLPWILIIVFWIFLINQMRKKRGPWGQDSAQSGSRDVEAGEN